MRYIMGLLIGFCIIQLSNFHLNVDDAIAKETGQRQRQDGQLLERIDFGNSYIMGQSIKSGAVYLLKRKKSDIKSMLRSRENYRKEILEDFHIHDMNAKN